MDKTPSRLSFAFSIAAATALGAAVAAGFEPTAAIPTVSSIGVEVAPAEAPRGPDRRMAHSAIGGSLSR